MCERVQTKGRNRIFLGNLWTEEERERISRNDDGVHKAGKVDGNQIMQEHFSQMMELIQASCPNSIGPTGKMLKI